MWGGGGGRTINMPISTEGSGMPTIISGQEEERVLRRCREDL